MAAETAGESSQVAEDTSQHTMSPDPINIEAAQRVSHDAAEGGATEDGGPMSPNARSKSTMIAEGEQTFGSLNTHPAAHFIDSSSFRVGVSEDRNRKCRRSMEDAHAFVYDYAGVHGQGFFAVFDGHAGKHAAEWCGMNFHEYFLAELEAKPNESIPDLLNSTFHTVDAKLSELAAADGTHSGCTAVTAFLRLEDSDGKGLPRENEPDASPGGDSSPSQTAESAKKRMFGDGVHRDKLRSLVTGSKRNSAASANGVSSEADSANQQGSAAAGIKRTLYTANVGDARAVLSRGGRAVRLTYDHKGSDPQEAKRITDAGGFVMNNRVNGVLAVTRSLGDSSMKSCIVGSPYTTETTLGEEDDFLIIACDGLWDVCEDQDAVDLIKTIDDPQQASRALLDHALSNFSTDNLSVLVVALRPKQTASLAS